MNKRLVFLLIAVTVILYALPLRTHLKPGKKDHRFLLPETDAVSTVPVEENQAPLMREEFISPPGEKQVHASSLAELADGTLAAVWYGGKHEGSKDTFIYFTKRPPCGDPARPPGENQTWTPPRGIVGRVSAGRELKRYIKKVGNPLIFTGRDNRLWLMFVTVSVGGWSGSSLNVKTSNDHGETWTAARRLTLSPFFNISELVRNNPAPLVSGGFAVPIYHEFIGIFSELLWLHPGADGDTLRYGKTRLTWGKRYLQPAMAATAPDRAVVFHRSHYGNGFIAASLIRGPRNALTAPNLTDLPNPDAGISAVRLSGERILTAYNHHQRTRENLSLAITDDTGGNCRRIATLENTPGEEFSYPYLLTARDGTIHLLYTWRRKRIKHMVFNQAYLSGKEKQ